MGFDHRFNRDEISKILKRAAELEHKDDVNDDSEGLTVLELQEVSKDVGIHPKYIQMAVNELSNPNQSVTSNLIGGPFTYNVFDTAEGTFTEGQWEEVVSEIRRIHGGIGKTGKLGKTLEWEQRKREVGYIQITLSPKNDHTKIHINANYRYFATMAYMFTGILGFMASTIFFKNVELSIPMQYLLFVLGISGLLSGTRFYLSNWMKRKREIYSKLSSRFKQMLNPVSSTEPRPSIAIPEKEQGAAEEHGPTIQRQQNLRH